MNKKTFLLSISSFIFLASCGGGGGGGGGSDMTSPPAGGGSGGTTYTYTKVTSQVSNYTWDTLATGAVIVDLPAGNYIWNNSTVYLEDFISDIGFSGHDNYPLDASLTEVVDSSSFDFVYSGQTTNTDLSISWNFNVNEFNIGLIDLYEFGDTNPSYGLAYSYYNDAEVVIFGAYDEYLATIGLEYVNGLQVGIVEYSPGNEYLLPTIFGDFTETGDMPTGNDSISFESISYFFEQNYDVAATLELAVQADGNLSINHSNNTLSGTMTLRRYADLAEFLAGNGATSQYSSLPQIDISITNGQIVGSTFTADLVVDDSANSGLELFGKMSGGFFGPNGEEVGASFFIYDNASDESDYYVGGGFLLGE